MNGQHSGGAPGHAFISYVREDRERVNRLQAAAAAAETSAAADGADGDLFTWASWPKSTGTGPVPASRCGGPAAGRYAR